MDKNIFSDDGSIKELNLDININDGELILIGGSQKSYSSNFIYKLENPQCELDQTNNKIILNGKVLTFKEFHEVSSFLTKRILNEASLTVYEYIFFNSCFNVKHKSLRNIKQNVDSVIEFLGLQECRNKIINKIDDWENYMTLLSVEIIKDTKIIFIPVLSYAIEANDPRFLTFLDKIKEKAKMESKIVFISISCYNYIHIGFFDKFLLLDPNLIYFGSILVFNDDIKKYDCKKIESPYVVDFIMEATRNRKSKVYSELIRKMRMFSKSISSFDNFLGIEKEEKKISDYSFSIRSVFILLVRFYVIDSHNNYFFIKISFLCNMILPLMIMFFMSFFKYETMYDLNLQLYDGMIFRNNYFRSIFVHLYNIFFSSTLLFTLYGQILVVFNIKMITYQADRIHDDSIKSMYGPLTCLFYVCLNSLLITLPFILFFIVISNMTQLTYLDYREILIFFLFFITIISTVNSVFFTLIGSLVNIIIFIFFSFVESLMAIKYMFNIKLNNNKEYFKVYSDEIFLDVIIKIFSCLFLPIIYWLVFVHFHLFNILSKKIFANSLELQNEAIKIYEENYFIPWKSLFYLFNLHLNSIYAIYCVLFCFELWFIFYFFIYRYDKRVGIKLSLIKEDE